MTSNFKAHFEDKALNKDALSYEFNFIKKVFQEITYKNIIEVSKNLNAK